MHESRSPIAVIAARLPYIDRRSLSEAWFAALHLATPSAAGGAVRARVAPIAVPEATPRFAARRDDVPGGMPRTAGAARGGGARTTGDVAEATRAARSRRTAPRAATQATRRAPAFRASLSLGVERERVQLLVRRDATGLHVVAVCRPSLAATVRRALADACRSLAASERSVLARVETGAGA